MVRFPDLHHANQASQMPEDTISSYSLDDKSSL